jgi:hypothetical protein
VIDPAKRREVYGLLVDAEQSLRLLSGYLKDIDSFPARRRLVEAWLFVAQLRKEIESQVSDE